MNPTLVETSLPLLGEVIVPTYMTALVVGFLVAVWLFRRWGEREGLPGPALVDLGFVMLVFGLIGARLFAIVSTGQITEFFHLCTDPARVPAPDAPVPRCETDAQCGPDYLCGEDRGRCHPPRDCLAALKFWRPGLVFYGGAIAASLAGLWYARRKRLPALKLADLAAPASMLALAIGRLGCFSEGCCYGAETASLLGASFPGHAHERHPTQLYEAGAALALFFALRYVFRPRARGPGEVAGWLFLLYGAARFALELLRADPRGGLGPLSTSQLVSIPVVLLGLWLVGTRRRRR